MTVECRLVFDVRKIGIEPIRLCSLCPSMRNLLRLSTESWSPIPSSKLHYYCMSKIRIFTSPSFSKLNWKFSRTKISQKIKLKIERNHFRKLFTFWTRFACKINLLTFKATKFDLFLEDIFKKICDDERTESFYFKRNLFFSRLEVIPLFYLISCLARKKPRGFIGKKNVKRV